MLSRKRNSLSINCNSNLYDQVNYRSNLLYRTQVNRDNSDKTGETVR